MHFNMKMYRFFFEDFFPVESEVAFTKTKVRLTDMMSHLDLAQAQLELLALLWKNKGYLGYRTMPRALDI